MAEHTNETTLANQDETIRRLVAERDELRRLVAAFGAFGQRLDDEISAKNCREYNRKQKGLTP